MVTKHLFIRVIYAGGGESVTEDNELMRRTALGDEEAFACLVERNRPRAERLALAILHDSALAQDAVQDCFVKVYLLRHEYRTDFTFQAYLNALVRNRCIDELRRRRRHPLLPLTAEAAEPPVEDNSPEALYLNRERRLTLLEQVRRLSAEDRELLTRFADGQQSYRDICRDMRLTMAQVKIRLYRIRKRLKNGRDEL